MKFDLKNKYVLIYGISSSGEWAGKLAVKKHAKVFLFDDNTAKLKQKSRKNCYILQDLNENLISQFDLIVVSPSIEPDNINLKYAEKCNVRVMSELEFASLFCKNLIAITGTNGKTTTVQITTALISAKKKCVACGNIGYPLSRAVLNDKSKTKVVEVSSFMLEHAFSFNPHIATVLNIQPDHLIRHKTMDEYSRLKMSIFKNMTRTDYCIVNTDLFKPVSRCKIITYSYSHNADCCVKDGVIYLFNQKVVSLSELKIKGKHNAYNVMCAICIAYLNKVSIKKMQTVLKEFTLEEFRIQTVGKIKDVTFINDSKSTNIASTLACTDAVKGSEILILCGSNKMLDYSTLFGNLTKRVKKIFVFGEITSQVAQFNNKFAIETCKNLDEAFEKAVELAIANDTIVFSPSSASFDQFSNYIERGRAFNQKVKDYEKTVEQK